jgi:hypothetical protein
VGLFEVGRHLLNIRVKLVPHAVKKQSKLHSSFITMTAVRCAPRGPFCGGRLRSSLKSQGSATIKRAEASDKVTRMIPANAPAVQGVLEAAGVEFIDENGGGPGVRVRRG